MSLPPQQQPQPGLHSSPSSQQQPNLPMGQQQQMGQQQPMGSVPPGAGDGWRTPDKRQLVIRKISEAVRMFPDVLARNPADVETSIFTRARSEHDYMNMVGKIVLSIKQKGLMQQQQQHQHAAAAAAAGGPGWTGMEMRQMGTNMSPGGNMLPNLPPGGGGYPSFPPGGGGGHMPPYGGVMGQRMMSYPVPPPPQQQMMHGMPPHNMGVTMRPYNMMNRAHPPPQRASLATNMPGSGEQVVSAVPNPSFPAPAATGEVQHPPGAPSPFTNHPSPYHAPPSVPPPSSVPPPQSSAQPAQANSPKPPQSVPSPRVSHPIPSPGTPWNPNSPSNTASPSQPPPPSNQPSLTPEGSNAVLLKLQELQCYIPLLARMIDRLQRGNEKDKGRTDQLTKLTSLYNVLQSKNMKVPLQTLEKCHIALKRIFEKDASMTSQPPPVTTQAPPQSQPTTTSTPTVTTNVETSNNNNVVTTTPSSVTPPRPPVPPTPPLSASMSLLDFKILHSPPPLSSYLQPLLEDREETDPLDRLPLSKKRKLEEQASKSFILGIKRELVDIHNYTIRKVSPKNSLEVNGSLCLEFTLVDDSLPAVPPLVMTLSPNYPRSSPHLQFNTDNISFPPPVFLKELEETVRERLAKSSHQYTISYALQTLESTLLQIMAKALRDE